MVEGTLMVAEMGTFNSLGEETKAMVTICELLVACLMASMNGSRAERRPDLIFDERKRETPANSESVTQLQIGKRCRLKAGMTARRAFELSTEGSSSADG